MINKTMITKRLPLKLDIQFFAEENPGEGGAGADTKIDPANTGSTTTTETKETKETKQEPETTFTQEQLSKVAAAEAKKAREKVLKDLGIEDVSKGKEALKAYKDQVEAQKTDAQKALDRAEALEKEKNGAITKLQEAQAELAALKQEADPEKVEDLVALANKYVDEDTDISAAIGKVLEKYPQFKREVQVDVKDPKKPNFLSTDHKGSEKPNEQDMWSQAFAFGKVTE